MGFSRQEPWSRLPFPSPEDLSDPGIEPGSLSLQADSLPSELQRRSKKRRNANIIWEELQPFQLSWSPLTLQAKILTGLENVRPAV